MYKTNIMSKRVFAIPVRAELVAFPFWAVSVSQKADPEFSFTVSSTFRERMGQTLEMISCDVFELRERVFGIRTIDQALELFREFGPWQVEEADIVSGRKIRYSEVLGWIDFFEHALMKRSLLETHQGHGGSREDLTERIFDLYLSWHLTMSLHFGDPCDGEVQCKDIQEALRTSLFLDKLDGFPWRKCQRKDCGKLFKLTSKRERLYCTTDCAHLQSVRSYNIRKANKAKTQKGKV